MGKCPMTKSEGRIIFNFLKQLALSHAALKKNVKIAAFCKVITCCQRGIYKNTLKVVFTKTLKLDGNGFEGFEGSATQGDLSNNNTAMLGTDPFMTRSRQSIFSWM